MSKKILPPNNLEANKRSVSAKGTNTPEAQTRRLREAKNAKNVAVGIPFFETVTPQSYYLYVDYAVGNVQRLPTRGYRPGSLQSALDRMWATFYDLLDQGVEFRTVFLSPEVNAKQGKRHSSRVFECWQAK